MKFDSMHNYYESLVIEYLTHTFAKEGDYSDDHLEDVACVALNQLPARYVRHDVDMAFFLSTRERERMQQEIIEAVLNANKVISERARSND